MSPIGAGSVARLACGAALVASTLGSAVACKPVELASGWAAGGIEVDGVDDEWIGATTYFEEQDVTIGLLNDAEFLYISLVSSGPVGRQAMATGLTVWFDPDGGTDEWYGIRHPVPPDPGERLGGGRGGGGRGAGRGRGPAGRVGGGLPLERMRQVELVGPGELNRRRLPLPLTGGLDVAVRNSGPTFVYELKVALRRDDGHRMGLGAAPGARIGVGLETGNIGEPGRGGPGGFAGGGFGGRSGQGGVGAGSGAGGRPERVAPLKVWVRVPLAAGP